MWVVLYVLALSETLGRAPYESRGAPWAPWAGETLFWVSCPGQPGLNLFSLGFAMGCIACISVIRGPWLGPLRAQGRPGRAKGLPLTPPGSRLPAREPCIKTRYVGPRTQSRQPNLSHSGL